MAKRNKFSLLIFSVIDLVLVLFSLWLIFGSSVHWPNFAVLNPKGIIAGQERGLMVTAILIMLTLAIPVYILLFVFIFKYRAGKQQAAYDPDWGKDSKFGFVLWIMPVAIIFTISVISWKSTHELDPYKPLASNVKPITIQVVALQWKWLFIYPEFNIATVNYIEFPKNTPINFVLTADAPMNTFWIPQLGSQVYAMPGMENQLHLMAGEEGDFSGGSSEISGAGFAGMKFVAHSVPQATFDNWAKATKQSSAILNLASYNELAKPSQYNSPASYSYSDKNLYNEIIMKYMAPSPPAPQPMEGMN